MLNMEVYMGQNIFVGLMAVAALVAGFLGWWFESGRSLKDDNEVKPDTEDTDKKQQQQLMIGKIPQ